jgi:CheY-like chemotaxis protein
MRPGSQPRHSAPRVTTFTGIGLGESSSAAIASGLPQQQQLLEGVSIVHMCDDPIRRLRTETHLEQHGALITAVERFDQLLVELVQQQHEVVVLDSSLIIPHLTTVDQIVNGMPTPSLVVFIAEQQLNSMPASVSFLPRPDLFTHLTSTLHAALDSPQRRILIELKDDRAFNPQTLAPLLNSPASLDALLVSFIGDTPELLAQIEEALDLADLALARGFNNALYDNASRLGLDAISHATASLATSLQPQGAAQAPLLLAQVEHEYMTAFSTILKLRSMLQNLT